MWHKELVSENLWIKKPQLLDQVVKPQSIQGSPVSEQKNENARHQSPVNRSKKFETPVNRKKRKQINKYNIRKISDYKHYNIDRNTSTSRSSFTYIQVDPDAQNEEKMVSKNPCKCKRSKCCVKYCKCMLNHLFCSDQCECNKCLNRYSEASHEKIMSRCTVKEYQKELESTYGKKGCTCKKIQCNKKYCECYQNKQKCTLSCKCLATNCLNNLYSNDINFDDIKVAEQDFQSKQHNDSPYFKESITKTLNFKKESPLHKTRLITKKMTFNGNFLSNYDSLELIKKQLDQNEEFCKRKKFKRN